MRGKIGDPGLGFEFHASPPVLRPIGFGQPPSHAETANHPAPDACGIPARPDARRNRQCLVERGDGRRAVAVLRQHPAEVFERGRVGKRARSASIERNCALKLLRRVAPDPSRVRRGGGARSDIRIEASAALSNRDSVFCEFLVTDRRRDAHAFGVVGDLVRVKRKHREPLFMTRGAEPLVRLHRVALRQGEKREVPHRMVSDARRPRLQHDLRDPGNLKHAGLVRGVDLEYAERHCRWRVQGSGDEVGLGSD